MFYKGEACNGDLLHQYWQIFKTNSQLFNYILLDSLNKQGKAQDTNDANMKKIKHFSDALDKLFAK